MVKRNILLLILFLLYFSAGSNSIFKPLDYIRVVSFYDYSDSGYNDKPNGKVFIRLRSGFNGLIALKVDNKLIWQGEKYDSISSEKLKEPPGHFIKIKKKRQLVSIYKNNKEVFSFTLDVRFTRLHIDYLQSDSSWYLNYQNYAPESA